MSLIDTMLSIFLMPSQCRTSGMSAWKRMSFTPAMSSVALKYLSAESPPRFLRLYTRYLQHTGQRAGHALGGKSVLGDLSEGAALLAEVDDKSDAAPLRAANAFLDRVRQVRLTRADVGAEYVRPVAYAIWSAGRHGRRTASAYTHRVHGG